ncbi:MAG: SMI1/KNR4 family protein [Alysiella sp.]|nr:SMI1/KNR4 family protein [Alysiella sp.]
MMNIFADFDFENFWDNNEYAQENYISEPLTDEMLSYVENELGFKLPSDYVEFMSYQNGGIPKLNQFHFKNEYVGFKIIITGILGIGETKDHSLLGEFGQELWIDEWEYPNDCVYFADTITGGHDMIAFDYSECGNNGEPSVVHIDQEGDYEKTFLAKDFATFVKGLKHDDDFDD